MEYGKVKINYTSLKNANAWVTDLLYLDYIDDYMIVENSKTGGLRFYTETIREHVTRCDINSLMTNLVAILDNDIDVIVINNFDIDYDFIRDKIIPLAKNYNAAIAVNFILEEDIEDKIVISLSDQVISSSEEEWIKTKEKIEMNIQKSIKEQLSDDYKNSYSLDEVKSMFTDMELEFEDLMVPIENSNIISCKDYNENIIEEYSYKKKNSFLKVSLLKDNNIVISNGVLSMELTEEQINFLKESIDKFI